VARGNEAGGPKGGVRSETQDHLAGHCRLGNSMSPAPSPPQCRRCRHIAQLESQIARNIGCNSRPSAVCARAQSKCWPAHFLITLETRVEFRGFSVARAQGVGIAADSAALRDVGIVAAPFDNVAQAREDAPLDVAFHIVNPTRPAC
jgi:hypothetical protein